VIFKNSKTTIEYQNPAGALYGAQAVITGDYTEDRVENPILISVERPFV